MLITSTISADLRTPGFPPLVYAVQGEQYSRQIEMNLYDGGLPWTVPGGVYIAMRYAKPDGTKGYYDTLPDGAQAWSVSRNVVKVFVAPQMLTAAGFVTAQLEIIQNQSILASFSLRLKVEANPAVKLQQSENYINWLKWMEDQLKEALNDAAESGEFTGPAPTLDVNTIQYQAGTSAQTHPSGEWLDSVPSVPQGQYLWIKHTIKWENSAPITEYSVAYQGQDGTDAQLETDTVDYQIGTSGTTPPSGEWSPSIPNPKPGQYFWTRRTKKWNTGTAKTDYSVAYAGTNGVDGAPATLIRSTVEYQVGTSGTVVPSGNWSESIPAVPQGSYLWSRTTIQFNTGGIIQILNKSRDGLDGLGSVVSVNNISPGENGNVELTADDVGAVPKSGGTMEGPLHMNGLVLDGLNDPTEPDEAARKAYVDKSAREAAPVNLLDNSDFTNPVAQAGIGGNHGTQAYAADRWILTNGSVSHTAGVGLTLNGTITQKMEHPPAGAVGVFVGMASGQASISYSDGAVTITSSGGVIAWAALYQGTYTEETMPEYRPKGYAAELAECRRYFQIVEQGTIRSTPTQDRCQLFANAVSPMRIMNPTAILIYGGLVLTGAGNPAIASIENAYATSNTTDWGCHYLIGATVPGISVQDWAHGYAWVNGKIDLSADL